MSDDGETKQITRETGVNREFHRGYSMERKVNIWVTRRNRFCWDL